MAERPRAFGLTSSARKLLDAPDEGNRPSLLRQGRLSDADDGTGNKRDRAILSTLLFHGLRREELCKLKVRDFKHVRKGVPYLKVHGKGGKIRYVELHPGTNAITLEYLDAAGHGADENGALIPACQKQQDHAARPARQGDYAARHL